MISASIDWPAFAVFICCFALVTVLGFVAARWRKPATLAHIDEWGLGGRQFGTWITWFLVGGDFYTAYTIIAVPALVYAAGAYGFFALPHTILVYPIVFLIMPRLWSVAAAAGHVTAADVVHARYGSRPLELAVAVTGVLATMPYIALQLIGMQVVIKALGLTGEIPLIVAFLILALYTYSAGLRAPALIAFVKDIMIYVVVLTAVSIIPLRLGGYGAVFAAAEAGFKAKGAGSTLLTPGQYLPYASLALGSALAAFMYPHTLTGIFASRSGDTIRKNAVLLPAYTLLLGLIALLGYMAYAAGVKPATANEVVPALFKALFPGWFAGFAFAAIAIGALVPAAVMSIGAANLFTRNFWKAYVNPAISARRGGGGENHLAGGQARRARLYPVPGQLGGAQPSTARRVVDPADLPGCRVRLVHALVSQPGVAGRLGGRLLWRHPGLLGRRPETAAHAGGWRRPLHGLRRIARPDGECRGRLRNERRVNHGAAGRPREAALSHRERAVSIGLLNA